MVKPSNEELRKAILSVVANRQGVKAVDLVLRVLEEFGTRVEHEDYELVLTSLVKENEIIELQYIVPNIDYRIKSIYFPKGTKIGYSL